MDYLWLSTVLTIWVFKSQLLEFYLLDQVKGLVYQQKIELWDVSVRCILDTASNMKDSSNDVICIMYLFYRRTILCSKAEGGHFEQLLLIQHWKLHAKTCLLMLLSIPVDESITVELGPRLYDISDWELLQI
jgi:hypothetical protein